MALVLLPGLNNLIEDISDEKKLAPAVVEAALREALLKGYERYRRTLYLAKTPSKRTTSPTSMWAWTWRRRATEFWPRR